MGVSACPGPGTDKHSRELRSHGPGRYSGLMTAADHAGPQDSPAEHPLAPGAEPDVIRAHLMDPDRARFDAALSAATEPSTWWECVEHWRGVAILQSDRAEFARVARRSAERKTGQPTYADEPLEITRAKAGI